MAARGEIAGSGHQDVSPSRVAYATSPHERRRREHVARPPEREHDCGVLLPSSWGGINGPRPLGSGTANAEFSG
jgi:hypothetical protein